MEMGNDGLGHSWRGKINKVRKEKLCLGEKTVLEEVEGKAMAALQWMKL